MKNTAPVVIITPIDLIQIGNPGDVKDFNISVTSEVALSHFRVFIKFENDFEVLAKDSLVDTKNFSWRYQYKIPQAAAGKTIYFRFSAVDKDGNEGLGLKQIISGDTLLTLRDGLAFFTFSNLSESAFNLETLQREASNSDSINRDIQEYVPDSTLTDSPTYRWTSPAGGKFVKANTYDFGNATYLTAKQVYEGSIALTLTDSLVKGDIYITRLGSISDQRYIVILVGDITNLSGSNLDNYSFSIKR